TGKTRVAMALAEIFLQSNQARRILFVADRDALVGQALKEGFQDHIPGEPCTRLRSYALDTTSRLYVVTLQTLSNIFRQFSPAFFDLIAFDEVHRSIFNKWNDVLHYFDARMIGLTATPADFIDRNTFLEFECFDGKPTFLYTLRDAVKEGYLVDYTLYAAQTRFQRQGIRGVDLTEEQRNLLIAQGLDPDAIDFSGTELERKVTNRDTLRKQWLELMEVIYKDASGHLPAKTIIFAMTQEHALRLAEVFAELYPQFPGLVQVITYKSDFHSTLIDRFKKEDMPRIAISVDMLETGVNVPEVANLVFMRPVQSRIKLEQMIGRGTRNQETCKRLDWLPNGRKDDFLIVDFWENDFSKTPQPEVAQSLPVLVNLFNTRLALLEKTAGATDATVDAVRARAVDDLRGMVERIPRDAFAVKRILPQIEQAWTADFWRYLPPARLAFLRLQVGPLLRYAADVDVPAATFTHKVERLKLQLLTHQPTAGAAQAIAEDAARLPDFVREDPARAGAIQRCLADLTTTPPDELSAVIDALAGQMRFRRQGDDLFLTLDLPDLIASRGYILLFGGSQEVYVESYRQQVEARILDLVAGHPTIAAIERGEAVADLDLVALERTLRQVLGGPGLEVTEANIRKAYGLRVGSLLEFVRALLEIDGIPDYQAIVQRQFDGFIGRHDEFNADQVRFLRAVQSVFVQQRRLARVDLYQAPLDAFGQDAVERLFAPEQVAEVLELAGQLEIE
ncbi:MAG: DEAD/DEAH box helicase family protein, partial [Caldilinea sp.]